MNLSLRTFAQTVSAMAASAQAAAAQALDFSTGSVLLAMSQAVAGVSLWLQWVSALVLQATRLTTSVGTDCDTFGADFGFTRLPAVASTGAVTFARYVPTNSATIPCGFPGLPVTVVKTVDGTQSFSVVADTTQSAYVADTTGLTAGNYVIPAGVSSCTATVQAIAPGTGGNVLANTIGLMATSVAGVDTVTNGAALSNGANAETDEAFKVRFGLFLPSLARGTPTAVESAVLGIETSLTCAVLENVSSIGGSFAPGFAVVAIDDGSGNTPASVIAAAASAVAAYRAIGTTVYVVQAPVISAVIGMSISVSAQGALAAIEAAIQAAIAAYVTALPASAPLPYTRLAQIAYDADARVTNVSGLTLNGGTSDIGGTAGYVVRVGSVAVT